jgi:hypothetical protein
MRVSSLLLTINRNQSWRSQLSLTSGLSRGEEEGHGGSGQAARVGSLVSGVPARTGVRRSGTGGYEPRTNSTRTPSASNASAARIGLRPTARLEPCWGIDSNPERLRDARVNQRCPLFSSYSLGIGSGHDALTFERCTFVGGKLNVLPGVDRRIFVRCLFLGTVFTTQPLSGRIDLDCIWETPNTEEAMPEVT